MRVTRRGLFSLLVPAAVAAPTVLEELLNKKTYFLPLRSSGAIGALIIAADYSVEELRVTSLYYKYLYGSYQYPIPITRLTSKA